MRGPTAEGGRLEKACKGLANGVVVEELDEDRDGDCDKEWSREGEGDGKVGALLVSDGEAAPSGL